MDFSKLKAKIEQVPGNARGRRRFPPELQREVVEAAETSGLGRRRFLSEVGLSAGSFYVMRSATKAQPRFRRVRVIQEEKPSMWEVSGPNGLRVSCQSASEVAQLWRAL